MSNEQFLKFPGSAAVQSPPDSRAARWGSPGSWACPQEAGG